MWRRFTASWLIIALIFSFVVVVIEIAPIVEAPTTIYVDDDYTVEDVTHKKTIQAAIDNASDGDTVFVYNGTYYENVEVNITINLTGISRDNTTIDGSGIGDVINVTANWVNITGFTIINSGFGWGDSGLEFYSNNNTVFDNNISDNGFGISLYNSNSNIISGNIGILDSWFGTYLWESSSNTICHNNWSGNGGDGIGLVSSCKNKIINNTCSNNELGVRLDSSSDFNVVENNDYTSNNWGGIYLYSSDNNSIANNTCPANTGSFGGYGIFIGNSNNNTIINNTCDSNKYYGIYLENSNGHQILNNSCSSNDKGIFLESSYNNSLVNNTVSDNIDGIKIYSSSDNNMEINFCSNNENGIYIESVNNITIDNNELINNGNGIYVDDYSGYNTIKYNILNSNTGSGIIVNYYSYNNTIKKNSAISNVWHGIQILSSTNNTISDNTCSYNEFGIYLQSNYNRIENNNCSKNDDAGIALFGSSNNNIIVNNMIRENPLYGMHTGALSNGNTIYHNNFINNPTQVYDESNNQWDNGYPSGGNYWSDYGGIDLNRTPNQDVPPPDGIGDYPYVIDSDSQDNFPLMRPSGIFLNKGWNLISIPLIQSNTNLSAVLSNIMGSYDSVQWYNISDISDPWKHYHIQKPSDMNDLNRIDHTKGFWIYITEPGGILFQYPGTKPKVNQTINIHPGWNLIGYPSYTSYNRTKGLNNLTFGSDVDAIWTYNAATQKWKELDLSNNFEPGRGYWIHSKVTKTWIVPL